MNTLGPLRRLEGVEVSGAGSPPTAVSASARPGGAATPAESPSYLLICNTADGLVAQLNGVVVQIQLARRMGLEPIVYLHQRSCMFGRANPYFDASNGPNAWDYYYEPIGPSPDELRALVAAGKVYTLSTASDLVRLFRWEPQSWFANPYGYFRSVENRADGGYPADWWADQRAKARRLLEDGTIRFRPAILDQVDRFVDKNFSEDTLGLQLRGSDKFDFGVGPNLSRKVTPEEYFPHIDRYLAEHPKCTRIFVATDQRQWLKALEQAYPGKIVSFSEWSLSDGDQNRFHDDSAKAARGVEVIVDLLLLSRCSYLLKCHAAVGEMAVTLVPSLGFLDLNYVDQPFHAKSRLRRILFAPGIRALSATWRLLAERGMGLTQVVSVEGDEVMVDPTNPRSINTRSEAGIEAPRPPVFSGRFVSDTFAWSLRSLGAQCFDYEERRAARGEEGASSSDV
jgi:hypothetical protein